MYIDIYYTIESGREYNLYSPALVPFRAGSTRYSSVLE